MLCLFLVESLPIRDPSRNELRELIGWNHADGVEVEVATVLACGLRMEDVSSLHPELPFKNGCDQRFIEVGCSQRLFERRNKLFVGEVTDGQEILLHPNGVPDTKALLSRQRCDRAAFGYPIGRRENFPSMFYEDTVVCES